MIKRHLRLWNFTLTSFCLLLTLSVAAQQKNFIDLPYLEVTGEADTLIVPDQIFLNISLSEKDTKNKITMEELEIKMMDALRNLGIDLEKKLTVADLMSNYRNYLLKKTDILKSKQFELEVNTADQATKVLIVLEELGISNINVAKVDHSGMKEIENRVRVRAVADARTKATALTQPLQQQVGPAIHIIESAQHLNTSALYGLQEVVVTGYSARVRGAASTKKEEEISFRKLKIDKTVNVTRSNPFGSIRLQIIAIGHEFPAIPFPGI